MDRDEAERDLERLPEWVPDYLACWGSVKPDGGRMTVTFAAEFAGTTADNVRVLRKRSLTFQRMEEIARQGTNEWAQTYVEAGLRGLAPGLMRALARGMQEGNTQIILKVAEWLRGKPQEVMLTGMMGVAEITPDDLAKARDAAQSLEDELLGDDDETDE